MSGPKEQPSPEEMQEFRADFAEVKQTLGEIKTAITGDRKLGLEGLASKVDRHDDKIRQHDDLFLKYSAGTIAATAVLGFIFKLLGIL